jgi:hypothetical protein
MTGADELEGDSSGDSEGSGGDSDKGEKFKHKDASAAPQLTRIWRMRTGNTSSYSVVMAVA